MLIMLRIMAEIRWLESMLLDLLHFVGAFGSVEAMR